MILRTREKNALLSVCVSVCLSFTQLGKAVTLVLVDWLASLAGSAYIQRYLEFHLRFMYSFSGFREEVFFFWRARV